MSDAILLTITDTARRKILNYPRNGLEVLLSHVRLGSGNYQHSKQTEYLAAPWGDFPIIYSSLSEANHCLTLTVLGRLSVEKTISEIGLYDENGQLFAVASKPASYFFKTQPGVYFTFSISVALDQDILGEKIKLGFSFQDQLLSALISLHGEHSNPHPQYMKFMRDIIAAHVLMDDPHSQYAMKKDAELAIKQYLDIISRLLKLYVNILGYACYAGVFSAGSNSTIAVEGFENSLLNGYPILITPEGGHEAWGISRAEKNFSVSVFNRSGTSRVGYGGLLNWIVLPTVTEAPSLGVLMPELIDCGVVNGSGWLEIKRDDGASVDYSKCVFLMCPEGGHEGWDVRRAEDKFTASIFNRSGTSRIGYGGKVSYAIFKKKSGALPLAYPGLLMSGVSENGNFSIRRPDGVNWDFTDSNYVLVINPEGGHEAWGISRTKEAFNVSVFGRSGTSRVGYGGKVNWAIFIKEPDRLKRIYHVGEYKIAIDPGQTIIVELFGAGAGGGGSVYTGGNTICPGDDGKNTSLKTALKNLLAGGGLGGGGGWWGNGSHMSEGWGGKGGSNSISISQTDDISISIEDNKDGIDGIVNRWSPQTRTIGYSALGYVDSNDGGAGAWGIGDESRAGGGSGGTGGYIRAKLKNISKNQVVIDLEVGSAGVGWTAYGNHGESGADGFAVITFL